MSLRRSNPALRSARTWHDAMEPLPSGQTAELFEVVVDTVAGESWVRFRFIAPEVAREKTNLEFDVIQRDFEHLCDTVVLSYVTEAALTPDVVTIALLDRAVDFGVVDPEATQLIEAFRIRDNACVWEGLW